MGKCIKILKKGSNVKNKIIKLQRKYPTFADQKFAKKFTKKKNFKNF